MSQEGEGTGKTNGLQSTISSKRILLLMRSASEVRKNKLSYIFKKSG